MLIYLAIIKLFNIKSLKIIKVANSGNQKLIYQKQNNWIGVLLLPFYVLFSNVIFAQFEPSVLFYCLFLKDRLL